MPTILILTRKQKHEMFLQQKSEAFGDHDGDHAQSIYPKIPS
jgi:hypothetical protein